MVKTRYVVCRLALDVHGAVLHVKGQVPQVDIRLRSNCPARAVDASWRTIADVTSSIRASDAIAIPSCGLPASDAEQECIISNGKVIDVVTPSGRDVIVYKGPMIASRAQGWAGSVSVALTSRHLVNKHQGTPIEYHTTQNDLPQTYSGPGVPRKIQDGRHFRHRPLV